MRGRWVLRCAVGVLVASTLSGCKPPAGYTGVSVDAQGDPVVVLAWCGRAPKQVVVNEVATGDNDVPNLTTRVLRAPDTLSGHSAIVNLVHPADGWTITNDTLDINDEEAVYQAYGETDSPDDTYVVEFSLSDLSDMNSAEVLGDDDYDETRVISYDDFTGKVARSC